jgi:hypothetical protein
MNLPLLATNFPLTRPTSSGWLSSIARVDGRTNKGSSHPIQAARAPCARSIQDRVLLSCRCLAQICRAGDSGTPYPARPADGKAGRNRGSRPVRVAHQCRVETSSPSGLDQIHTREVTFRCFNPAHKSFCMTPTDHNEITKGAASAALVFSRGRFAAAH